MSRRDDFDRLVKVETDACVMWPYGNTSYTLIAVDGAKRYVHVLACEQAHGPRPVGYEAAHNCGVTGCLNPRHLRWTTHADNQADRLRHGTHNRGERHGCAKLTADQVQAIRHMAKDGRPQAEIAARFGVSKSTVSMIKNGTNWGWLAERRTA